MNVSSGAAESFASQVAGFAESAVLVPVGAALELGDRVVSVVRPWTASNSAEKELNRVRRDVRRFERRGSTARNRLVRQLRKRRTQVTRLVRGQRRQAERTLHQRTKRARVQVKRQQRQAQTNARRVTRQTRDRVQQYV